MFYITVFLMSEKHFEKMISLLEEISKRLKNIEGKLNIEETAVKTGVSALDILSKSAYDPEIRINKSHIKTYFTVQKLGTATCKEVAAVTGRAFNLESRYLVALHKEGFLDRERSAIDKPSKDNPESRGTEVRYFIKERK